MAEENQLPPKPKPRRWIPAKDGSHNEIYGNFVHPTWTLFDVRIRVGILVPDEADASDFVVEERAAITVSWPQAKNLRDVLTGLVTSYEEANGEIKPLKLPPDPSAKWGDKD